MTKQQPSATKLRLSKLFRWLAVLCFIKLSMLCMLLLDVPLPSWLGGAPSQTAFVPPVDPLSDAAVMEKLTVLVAASRQEGNTNAAAVDPFSLYLSLKDGHDDRVQICLDEMMENVKW